MAALDALHMALSASAGRGLLLTLNKKAAQLARAQRVG